MLLMSFPLYVLCKNGWFVDSNFSVSPLTTLLCSGEKIAYLSSLTGHSGSSDNRKIHLKQARVLMFCICEADVSES